MDTSPPWWRTALRRRPLGALAAALSAALGAGLLAPQASAAAAQDRTWQITRSPGPAQERLTARVDYESDDGTLRLSVRRGGATVLEPAPIGLVTAAADLSSGLRPVDGDTRTVTERYTSTVGKERDRHAVMTESRLSFAGEGGHRLDVVVRVSDDGVAYRYVVPEQGTVEVRREASAFQPPADADAWLRRYTPNYERPHETTTAAQAPTGQWSYPALFRTGDTHVLLTESDVDGRYSGSRLTHTGGDPRYTVELADEAVTSTGPLATPWRTAIIGSPAQVAQSTLPDDLAPDSRIADTSWIRPGTVAWSWLAGFHGAQRSLSTQQEFVDYSAAHGWEYTLVDDGWKTTDWMPELIEYAQRRGVKILLWMHWSDLDTAEERTTVLDRVVRWGAAGLKIDFMDSDAQERYRWYDDVLAETARRKLLVNFHGSTIPHGIQRTWPHVMTMEAVYGAEQGDVSARDITTLPYTRNAVGSMDYTPMGFQFGRRTISDAAELALSVVYESGLQHYAGSIGAYRQRPHLERFLEQVPTVWDTTRLLAGTPGQDVTFARRSGDRWFLGGVHAGAARTERIPLDFLGSGTWLVEVVRDGADGLVRESKMLSRHDTLQVPTATDGGFAAIACRHPRAGEDRTCDRPVDRLPLTTLTARPDRAGAEPGTAVEVSGTFTVEEFGPVRDARLTVTAPGGWAVRGEQPSADSLGTGEELTGQWTVTAPAEVRPGHHDIVVAAEYRAPGDSGDPPALRTERTVRVFVSPPGVDFVSDLPFVSADNGWGPVERDHSNGESGSGDGGPLTLRGTAYDKGLGVHAHSEVTVDLGGRYDRFTAEVGIDDEVTGTGSVVFEVVGDGAVLARSPVLGNHDAPHRLQADLTGVQRLTLRVTDGGDGIDFDHGDWADARLHLAG
ncbi:MAG TPA: glycoside hydrolase family 97 catalytic domain-containing protein [Streptomyces sp.]|uniref:glycoside hydrolase family 97 catalytic domain-containing protein n=1 Tax=Streptomyces sp. TaxID=1931 RepID=UPI002D570B18|nr:glycoside hydrolase family 97 catalytic domain-containing protein [Streptomyces sp.]HZG06207.1 glycoside hydrolase family 97 catalytic domain-containing protein [Streptomyces sp.]